MARTSRRALPLIQEFAAEAKSMKYDEIQYIPEDQDPSLTIETHNLVAKVIDNTGLSLADNADIKSHFGRYGTSCLVPYSHHLGNHGLRTLYDKEEKRNLVVPLGSWLNLQAVSFEGIENDPVDERAWAGVGRGWPMRLEPRGLGAVINLDPMPKTQFRYTIEFQPAEPDGIEFVIRFTFHTKPDSGPVRFRAAWPCYMNAYDDVRFFYPKGSSPDTWDWGPLGEKPDIVIGEPVGYTHQQTVYRVEQQALPIGFGRIGDRALTLMFDDPAVKFFVVNAGGHFAISPVQNPAWDFEWQIEDYPLNEPVGFRGRLIYSSYAGEDQILQRYREWMTQGR